MTYFIISAIFSILVVIVLSTLTYFLIKIVSRNINTAYDTGFKQGYLKREGYIPDMPTQPIVNTDIKEDKEEMQGDHVPGAKGWPKVLV